jgi:protocatechuate 3,4-dioxygenase beta subunit
MFVVGRVVGPDGKPVPNARVMVHAAIRQPGPGNQYETARPSPIGRAICDGAGRFRLNADRTTSARHHLVGAVATAPGFGAGWVELDPDADRPDADITLRPEQVIEGRLFDVHGQPVGGVRVEVHVMGRVVPAGPNSPVAETIEGPDLPWSHGRERPGWPGPATSDDQGRFTLRGIGRGIRIVLGIDDPRFARLLTTIDTDTANGPKVATIALEPARIIVGRVTDADSGQPIPHARLMVTAIKRIGGVINTFEADDQGHFRMNPMSADRYSLNAFAPPGDPYLNATIGLFAWPKGAIEHRVDVSMHRGNPIVGRVVEDSSGRPVAGARVSFAGRRGADRGPGGSWNGAAVTSVDGSFRLAAVPGKGYLTILAPSDDYVYQAMGASAVREGRPGGPRVYAHAFVPHEAGPDARDVTVTIRPGRTVRGRVVGPDGQPVPLALMIGRIFVPPTPMAGYVLWRYGPRRAARDGRFEIHGLDPDAEVPVHFLDSKRNLGATAMLSGKSGSTGPVTVRLEPCGTARLRLVDRDGKPAAGIPGRRLTVSLVVTPGASQTGPEPPPEVLADEATFAAIDPAHHGDGLISDADGRLTLPALIPGATYGVRTRTPDGRLSARKEFTVKPGETVDLGEIVVQRPPG